jgi:hypothetical protein
MKQFSVVAALLMGLLALTSCGGGGGGAVVADTVVSGVASKGIIKGGSIKIYVLNADGSKGALLKETTTDANGAYSANLGKYQGAVLLEASGSYTDEATGAASAVSVATPLRAALAAVSGAVSVAVTPLTELAVQLGADLTTGKLRVADLAANNALVAAAFKVDILTTMPADALVASGATAKQKEHALVLAAFAQLMQSQGKDLHAVIAEIKDSIGADGKIGTQVAGQFQVALASFAKSSANQTGINDISATTLINIGGTSRTLTVSVAGTASLIGGLEADVILPPGVTVKTGSDGSLTAAALQALGGVLADALLADHYTPATASARGSVRVGIISGSGFAAGGIFTLQCDIAPDAAPQNADFVLTLLDAINKQGVALTGLTLSATLGQ